MTNKNNYPVFNMMTVKIFMYFQIQFINLPIPRPARLPLTPSPMPPIKPPTPAPTAVPMAGTIDPMVAPTAAPAMDPPIPLARLPLV